KLYTIADLTTILNLHQKTILRFIHEGKIKARKIGRSWMVSADDLRDYCHCELSDDQPAPSPNYATLKNRITASAVIEIIEQNSAEASRLSNSFIAMLNSERGSDGRTRFDFFYFPEIEKAKYVFYGSPEFVEKILHIFIELGHLQGEGHE
ncbi:helix-turn-helix domain-containing protein, partial [candidate division KSB1 bacterium]|nr:helix-turn-helix domain-containing protein [candidate division KSB1 bacterium]